MRLARLVRLVALLVPVVAGVVGGRSLGAQEQPDRTLPSQLSPGTSECDAAHRADASTGVPAARRLSYWRR